VPAYHLVQDHVSRDTVEALATLNEGANAGDVIGTAVVVILKGRRFFTNVTGEAFRDPHLTRGLLCCLDDELRDLTAAERPRAEFSWPTTEPQNPSPPRRPSE
jgi:hypothetical protein